MLEEYIKELEKDLKIDELNLKDYQLCLPAIKHKWAGRLIRLKLELIEQNKTLEKLKRELTKEIEKAAPVKLNMHTVNQMIESHDKYKEFRCVIEEKRLIIELLERTEKTLNSTTYDIKNLVEIMKLETT